ncbi:conserved hypothetical protein [Histoplasma capsulatum var. duboisii H88]|uniref:Regulatory protein, C2H2 transcription factor (AmdA), conidia-enriched transcript n=2 Tax=Ajellomyces capsulatus TaxID=5037 RepID=F0UM02_AJEC8|nr:regulatory protein [Histoplasma capsulatum H143]EGC48046.1 conserved hypothetical protein [Histoplasma capsulatum var. duboisii H88]QSS54193.1 regulatory protein, C2H2 transcription factor (AmdA), conidia-enriched transcript [Histoplasma capsulatum var. duboisii H88]
MLDPPTAKHEEPQEGTIGETAATKKPKRFQCMRCETRFARLEHLQRHERIHTQEKPFCCQLCDHRFTRSDLLIRHERLSHNNDGSRKKPRTPSKPRKPTSKKSAPSAISSVTASPMTLPPFTIDDGQRKIFLGADVLSDAPDTNKYPLATLTMAAEHVASQMPDRITSTHAHIVPENMGHSKSEPVRRPPESLAMKDSHAAKTDLRHSINELAAFLDDEARSPYQSASMVSVEHPVPFSWLEPTCHPDGLDADIRPPSTIRYPRNSDKAEEIDSLSRLGPCVPSILQEDRKYQTGQTIPSRKPLSKVSLDDRQDILSRLEDFSSVMPSGFQLPSRLALSRYIASYINGFHEHFPFLHVSTMSIGHCLVELILAMAAVGAQYCFENERAIELLYASKKIAITRIGRRDAKLAAMQRQAETELASSAEGIDNSAALHTHPCQDMPKRLGLQPEPPSSLLVTSDKQDLIQPTQALLILMALATWAKHKELLREALALQSMLFTLVRDDGLRSQPVPDDISWDDWIELESIKRTKFIAYCFFNLHCIVYNIPSPILNSELNLYLPCSAAEFKAPSRLKWMEARVKAGPQMSFQTALNRLFSHGGNAITECNSSLGNYILIHAILQHIFCLRHFSRGRFDGNRDVAPEDIAATEQALWNWQTGSKRSPQSSLDPQHPDGPVAFNSTALLRLAYIRLNIYTGPGIALDTRDPIQIAKALRTSPRVKRTPKLVCAVLHSARALSIPIKIGIRLVAQTQTFIWSIQHLLCSLESAILLSKWLEALSQPNPDPPVSYDERRIGALVKMMLDETEFAIASNLTLGSPAMIKQINAGVLRVWAKIFKGAQTWAIIDTIGNSLNIYADMIEDD